METEYSAKKRAFKAAMSVISVIGEPILIDLWKALGITLTQFRCLRLVQAQPENAGDLAKKLNLSPTSLTRVLERLENRHLIERGMDQTDRRRILVRLTPEGEALLSTQKPWQDSRIGRALDRLDEARLKALAESLEQLVGAVQETPEIPVPPDES